MVIGVKPHSGSQETEAQNLNLDNPSHTCKDDLDIEISINPHAHEEGNDNYSSEWPATLTGWLILIADGILKIFWVILFAFPRNPEAKIRNVLRWRIFRDRAYVVRIVFVGVFVVAAFLGSHGGLMGRWRMVIEVCPSGKRLRGLVWATETYEYCRSRELVPTFARFWTMAPVAVQDAMMQPCLFAWWITGGAIPKAIAKMLSSWMDLVGLEYDHFKLILGFAGQLVPLFVVSQRTDNFNTQLAALFLPILLGQAIHNQYRLHAARLYLQTVLRSLHFCLETRIGILALEMDRILPGAFPRVYYIQRSLLWGKSSIVRWFVFVTFFLARSSVDVFTALLVFWGVLEYSYLGERVFSWLTGRKACGHCKVCEEFCEGVAWEHLAGRADFGIGELGVAVVE